MKETKNRHFSFPFLKMPWMAFLEVTINANELTSIDQVRDFLSGTQRVVFEASPDKESRYDRTGGPGPSLILRGVAKRAGGSLVRDLVKVSGYSPAPVKRLIKRDQESGRLTPSQRTLLFMNSGLARNAGWFLVFGLEAGSESLFLSLTR